MEKVIKILMARDGLSYEDAKAMVIQCQEDLLNALSEGEMDLDYIIEDELGLEPDYIEDLLF